MKTISEIGLRRVAAGVLILTFLMGSMVWLRALYGSMQCWREGERSLRRGEQVRAITFFDRSIHWYAPLNPYVGRSAERLWELAQEAEIKGDDPLALMALRAIERGFRSASSFFQPGTGWLERCERKIREILAAEDSRPERGQVRPPVVKPPDPFWAVILEVGFLGWIGSVIGFIVFVFQDRKRPASPVSPALIWATLGLISFFLWFLGLIRA